MAQPLLMGKQKSNGGKHQFIQCPNCNSNAKVGGGHWIKQITHIKEDGSI